MFRDSLWLPGRRISDCGASSFDSHSPGDHVGGSVNASRFVLDKLKEVQANARECRLLAATSVTEEGRQVLEEMAEGFSARATELATAPNFRRGKSMPWWQD